MDSFSVSWVEYQNQQHLSRGRTSSFSAMFQYAVSGNPINSLIQRTSQQLPKRTENDKDG